MMISPRVRFGCVQAGSNQLDDKGDLIQPRRDVRSGSRGKVHAT